MIRWAPALLLLGAAMSGCLGVAHVDTGGVPAGDPGPGSRQTSVPVYGFRVLRAYPHDPTAYTEGLTVYQGALYEGTGLRGQSKLRRLDLATGAVQEERPLPAEYFGEGVTVLGEEIYQLTYQSNVGFVYDRTTFRLKRTFRYPSQGWGLTTDGTRLIMSNGSAALVFIDPASMERTGYVVVSSAGGAVGFLNELEYIDGKVYANVWQTDLVVVIAPDTGAVRAWIDLGGLNPEPRRLRLSVRAERHRARSARRRAARDRQGLAVPLRGRARAAPERAAARARGAAVSDGGPAGP